MVVADNTERDNLLAKIKKRGTASPTFLYLFTNLLFRYHGHENQPTTPKSEESFYHDVTSSSHQVIQKKKTSSSHLKDYVFIT